MNKHHFRLRAILFANLTSLVVAVASTVMTFEGSMRTVVWVTLIAGWIGVIASFVAWRRERARFRDQRHGRAS